MEIEENETNDYIASVINNRNYKDKKFIIVSTDSDFIQLINNNTYLYVSKGKTVFYIMRI